MSEFITSAKRELFGKKNAIRFLISAVLFALLAIPFKEFFSLMEGASTEVRPANVIPPVLGILWGPIGALGISVGNLVSDIIAGCSVFVCVTGFMANFLYAYIPYKLWYTIAVDEKDISPYLTSVKKIIKYMIIIFVDSVIVSGMLATIFQIAFGAPPSGSYIMLFFNNFDFALILGVVLLAIISKFNVGYYVPVSKRHSRVGLNGYDFLLVVSGVLGLIGFALSYFEVNIPSFLPWIILIGAFLTAIPILNKKYNFNSVDQVSYDKNVISIKTNFTIIFFVIAVIFLAIEFAVLLYFTQGMKLIDMWNILFLVIGISVNIIFGIAVVFLLYIEKNIINRLIKLKETAEIFASVPKGSEDLNLVLVNESGKDEITSLSKSFNNMMTDIATYTKNIRKVTAEKERIGAELNVATNIQASMLPCIFPAFPGRDEFDIYALMRPAKEVGGDFYDFFLIDDNRLAMVIADVSGKGVPAALFMVIAKTLLKNTAQAGLGTKEILEKVNNQLCENNEVQMFVTVWIGILEIDSGKMTCANAGHEYPIVQRGEGEFELIKDKHGFVLAGIENAKYKEYNLDLAKGDRLFVYTDGVAEATNANNELYGTQKLLDVMNRNKKATSSQIIKIVLDDVDKFVGEAPQFDDITMLTLQMSK